jgi:hypothetical protein
MIFNIGIELWSASIVVRGMTSCYDMDWEGKRA